MAWEPIDDDGEYWTCKQCGSHGCTVAKWNDPLGHITARCLDCAYVDTLQSPNKT